jgi:hypothetical protein
MAKSYEDLRRELHLPRIGKLSAAWTSEEWIGMATFVQLVIRELGIDPDDVETLTFKEFLAVASEAIKQERLTAETLFVAWEAMSDDLFSDLVQAGAERRRGRLQ